MKPYDIHYTDVLNNFCEDNNLVKFYAKGDFFRTMGKPEQIDSCQAWMIDSEIGIVLQSYNTLVAMIDHNGKLYCSGTYSATTRNHIGRFAKEFGLSYYDFKAVIK